MSTFLYYDSGPERKCIALAESLDAQVESSHMDALASRLLLASIPASASHSSAAVSSASQPINIRLAAQRAVHGRVAGIRKA